MNRRDFLRSCVEWSAVGLAARATVAEPDRDRVREAAERGVERYRKGDFVIRVRGAQGSAPAGVPVNVWLQRHDFRFGNLFRPRHYDNDRYRERFLELFNFVELLEFNWGQYEPDEGRPLLASRRNFIDGWCAEHGLTRFYGHMLVWTRQYGQYPRTGLPLWLFRYDKEKQYELLRNRIQREVRDYRDVDIVWDVVNEPVHVRPWGQWDKPNHYAAPLADVVPYVSDALRWARNGHPEATLLVNEYGIFLPGKWRDRLVQLLEQLRVRDVAPDCLGLQAHEPYKGQYWYAPEELWTTYELFGRRLGFPLYVTEFWYVSSDLPIRGRYRSGQWTPDRQAEAIEEFYRISFGHPSVRAIVYFGMSDADVVRPGLGLFDRHFRPKPAWHRLKDLLTVRWTTRCAGRTDAEGNYRFRGFFGRYRVRVGEGRHAREWHADFLPNGPTQVTLTWG